MTLLKAHPKISVVTPAYNPVGDDLNVVVAALNAQTFRDFEWVLVDDGSAAAHQAAIAGAIAASKAPAVVLRQQINAGQAAARNAGVLEAQGDYVKFLDADDALDPTHLENLLRAAESAPADVIVFAPTRHVFLDTGREFVNTAYQVAGETSAEQLASQLAAPFLHHCGALFPRSLLLELGPYDTSLCTDEDGDLLIRMLQSGRRFQAVPTSSYVYRHQGSRIRVSRDDNLDKLKARRRVSEKVLESYEARNKVVPPTVRRAVARRLDDLAVKSWTTHRTFADDLLGLAAQVDPSAPPSGSRVERALRRSLGISGSIAVMAALRRVRGVMFS